MKKIITFCMFVMFVVCSCSNSKMTKLETELDKIISQYDVKYWRADTGFVLKSVDSMFYSARYGANFQILSNDTLNEKLKDFAKYFFSNVDNFKDLTLCRLSEYHGTIYDENLANLYKSLSPEYYVIDTLLYSGKYQIDFCIKIINAPYRKIKISSGEVEKLTPSYPNNNEGFFFDVKVYKIKENIYISIPSLTLELTDAEFEQVK